MTYYYVNQAKKKEVYSRQRKAKLKESGGFVKFSYFFEKVLLVISLVLSILVIVNVIFLSRDPLDLLFLILAGGFPLLLSIIFKTIYKTWLLRGYGYRKHEVVGFDDNQFEYSYIDSRLENDKIFTIRIAYSEIDRVIYSLNTGEVSIYGKLYFEETQQEIIIDKDIWKGTAILNIFDIDILEVFKKYHVIIEEEKNG